mgnify:CR=1 FL=1
MKNASILIVDPKESENLKERLEKMPDFTVLRATNNVDIGFALAERHQPGIIIFNVDLPGNEGIAVAEVFALEFPNTSLILITNSDSKRVLRCALRIGAKEVITLPIEDEKLYRLLQRVIQTENERQELVTVEKKVKPEFKTLVVFSTKGGVGKTTIALNTAIAISKLTHKRTVLVDLNLMSGNVALMSGIPNKYSIKDVIDELANIDMETLDSYCTEHSSGLKILPAPANPDSAIFIGAEDIEKIHKTLAQTFNYIIFDCPNYFHDTVIPALETADEILVVSTLDLAAIQNLKQCMEMLTNLNLRRKVRIILNRVGYTGGLKVKDLENELGTSIFAVVPNFEKIAVNAVNMGIPIIESKNYSAGKYYEDLAVKLVASENHPRPLAGWKKIFAKGGGKS